MSKGFYLFLVVSLLFFFICKTQAQTSQEAPKIGVIDIKRVINTSKYGQEVMDQLQKKYEELQAKLEAKGKEIEALKEEIEKKSQLWSPEVREKKQSDYQKKLRELKTLQEDAQFEMQELERKLLDPVFRELEIVIKNFVEKEKYDLIMEKTQPGIYYASPKVDISLQIIDLFDKHYEEMKGKKKGEAFKSKESSKTAVPQKNKD